MRLFVFQNQTTLESDVSVSKVDNGISVHVDVGATDNYFCTVDIKHMHEGDSAIVVYSPVADRLFTLYNYRELLQMLGSAPSETYSAIHAVIVAQVDIVNKEPFIKMFLSSNQYKLHGDLDSFDCVFKPISDMHALDLQFSYDTKVTFEIDDDMIIFSVYLNKNAYEGLLYFNYGNQSCKLNDNSVTNIVYDYIPNEDAFIGPEHSRLEGRRIHIHAE